jgi:outer membrane protein OmpA-like peptidoglycan-associated protein
MTVRALSVKAAAFLAVISLSFATTVVVAPFASAATVPQASPTSGSVTTTNSTRFTDQLSPTTFNSQPVNFVTVSPNTNLSVSSTGAVSTVGGPLPANTYTVSGMDDDGIVAGDTGSWSYTLTVTGVNIPQGASQSGTTAVSGSSGFTDQLGPATFNGQSVVFTTTSPNSNLAVSSSGAVSTTGGPLPVNSYTVSGTDVNGIGDTGTWSYALTVTGVTLTQTSPTSGTTSTARSSTFNPGTIAVNNNTGAVSFVTIVTSSGLNVSSAGVISTTGTLAPGTYTVSGTDTDTVNDSGTWTYTLTVNADPTNTTLTQTSPTTGVTTTTGSSIFTSGPLTAANNVGAVTFTVTNSSPALTLRGNQISTTGALSVGHYTVSGTDRDTGGRSGTWTYTLTVTNSIVQTSPKRGVTTSKASSTFKPGSIVVTNSSGTVAFVTTVTSTGLNVSSVGVISTTGTLTPGIYTISGMDTDANGDTGTWTYTLTVSNIVTTVTFNANRGKGSMIAERHNKPTVLTGNRFTRAGFTFVDWNTALNGSGASYANGATYAFTKSTTLYAQWRAGKVVAHAVRFNANGGSGTMGVERENTPTGLAGNRFTRAKYTFVDWNTALNGSGASYANGATYAFTKSTTLYAQWKIAKVPTKSVTFRANGGRGAMAPERRATGAPLTINRFTRSGYNFVKWSSAANGSGASYVNGATYPFTTSTTLYAQWRRKPTPKPAVPASAIVGPFPLKSSALFPSLQGQIANMASTIKANRDTTILLVGYGDKLSKAEALNESLWAANISLSQRRASAVGAYLKQRLTALGVKGFTITTEGKGAVTPSSTNQSKTGLVSATLS